MRTPKQRRPDAVPRDPRERSIWIQGELRKLGSNLSVIARELGVSRRAVSQSLFVPSSRAERAVAAALGLSAEELFPERFNEEGRRLHPIREPKDTRVSRSSNVEDRQGI